MPLGPTISPTKRARFHDLRKEGLLQKKIAKHLGICQSTASHQLKQLRNNANYYYKVPKAGHSHVLDDHVRRFITRKFYSRTARNAADLGRKFYLAVA
jgi:predicted transcriptional regulator